MGHEGFCSITSSKRFQYLWIHELIEINGQSPELTILIYKNANTRHRNFNVAIASMVAAYIVAAQSPREPSPYMIMSHVSADLSLRLGKTVPLGVPVGSVLGQMISAIKTNQSFK